MHSSFVLSLVPYSCKRCGKVTDLVITDCSIQTLLFQFKSGDSVRYNDRESRSFSVLGEDDVFHEISQVHPN